MRCHLKAVRPEISVRAIGRAEFNDATQLSECLSGADAVIHLAGVNRGPEDEVEQGNIRIAEQLATSLSEIGSDAFVVFSSSTHSEGETPYGRSKRRATEILSEWADRSGAKFANLVLPHVFGECGKPFYNSVVSTFCHQLASGDAPVVENDSMLELMHAQHVAALVMDTLDNNVTGDLRPNGHSITVSELLQKLSGFSTIYKDGRIPDLRTDIDLRLFNTYRSYLFPQAYPAEMTLHTDDRGSLFEAVKSDNGGQSFMSTTKPGITRGEHFHLGKVERFIVTGGRATVRVRRLFDEKVHEFEVSGDKPVFVDMPTMHTHNITNSGSELLTTLFWTNEIFDPDHPDTYGEQV